MINYTERISLLMQDVIERTPRLSFIDLSEVVVFGRFGRSDAEGAFATCHCLTLPESEPGYYFWRDRITGELTRRSEWFITKSPEVRVGVNRIKYLISFVLPRFCDQTLERSRKADLYPAGTPGWIAKLDTIVHELYHIDPERGGIRRMERADGTASAHCHGQHFFRQVVSMVKQYLATNPNPEVYDFLRHDFTELQGRFGGVVGTTFRAFPSYPQRYTETVVPQPSSADADHCRVDPIKPTRLAKVFTEDDLVIREFLLQTSRRLVRKGAFRAA
jgi:hypothetical protein